MTRWVVVVRGRESVVESEASVCGEIEAMKSLFPSCCGGGGGGGAVVVEGGRVETSMLGAESSAFRTSVWDWRETRIASAEVTQPEQARQSVRLIWAEAAVVVVVDVDGLGLEGS